MLTRLIANRWFQSVLLLVLLGFAVAFSFSHTRWREQIRNFTFDNYNIMRPREASDNIIIVDIDEASLRQYGQMPWPRDLMAMLVTNLKEMGAKVIVFVEFGIGNLRYIGPELMLGIWIFIFWDLEMVICFLLTPECGNFAEVFQ